MALNEYDQGSALPGKIGRRVVIDVSGDLITHSASDVRVAMASQ